MKRLRIDALLFIIIISVFGISNLLNTKKPTVSELENRALKQMPVFSVKELFDGRYLKGFEDYYSDTFILRETLVKYSRDIRQALSFMGPDVSIVTAYEDIQSPQDEKQANEIEEDNTAAKSTETVQTAAESTGDDKITSPDTSAAGTTTDNNADFGDQQNVGYWLVVDGKAVQLFKFNKSNFEYYSQVLNKYKEKLGDGVKLYSMIPPSASEFVQLKKYKGITDSQNDALDFLKSKLDRSITSVNVYDELNKHKEEYIYFRTDHHWTALGAYYGYVSFMAGKGMEPIPLEQYKEINLGSFLGSSYSKTLSKSLEKNPDTFIAYEPFTNGKFLTYSGTKEKEADVLDMKYADNVKNKYLVFISSGGATWSVIRTDVRNGQRILVMKDSFGNALVPFLMPHYEEIYIVDSRFYSISAAGKNIVQFIQDNKINEVLFETYMENVNWHKFMNGVEKLLGNDPS